MPKSVLKDLTGQRFGKLVVLERAPSRSYPYYGGRGIRVCERWMNFQNFYADMGDRPVGMSLERERVNASYEPGNCCWASLLKQARNKRSTVVTLEGVQDIIQRFEQGETKASLGRRFGLKPSYVGALINGKAWTDVDRPYLNKVHHG